MWSNLAVAYSKTPGQKERAKDGFLHAATLCREALKANPNDAVVLSDLAMFVASEGNERQEPLVLIERALALAPQDTDVQFNAAETYESLGYRKEALDWVAKLIAAGVSAGRHQPEPGAPGPRQGQTLPEHSPGTEKIAFRQFHALAPP